MAAPRVKINEIYKIDPKNYTLLIVDDEADLREVLAYQFKKDGFNIVEASNGKEAFEIVQNQKIDLIVSDIQMPVANGIQLLDNVRANHLEVPIVLFITGYAGITLEEAFAKGAEAVFSKPFDRKVLLNTILQALTPKDEGWTRIKWRGEIDLHVELMSSEINSSRPAKVLNLGRGGVFIAVEEDVPKVGAIINFKIDFDEKGLRNIEGRGIVRWTRSQEGEFPKGCGVEFVDLSDTSKSKIIELINFIRTKQYLPKK